MKVYLFLLCFILGVPYSLAAPLKLKQLIAAAQEKSPLLNTAKRKQDMASAAVDLATSFYFPTVGVKQTFTVSNNPINVFGAKLGQQEFKMEDFQVDKLNNPDSRKNHQTSLYVQLPIDLSGMIRSQKKSLSEQKASVDSEMLWTGKEVTRYLYALYYVHHYMDELASFYQNEKDFLAKIIKSYDAATTENKNRYLSFNQAKIIMATLEEGLSTLE